jgi:hypothetical protein
VQTVAVGVSVADSSRPPLPATVEVTELSSSQRLSRGLKRFAIVSGAGLGLAIVPLVHLCGALVVVIGGPLAGYLAWRATVECGSGEVPCARCERPVFVKAGRLGWPLQLHCDGCGCSLEVKPSTAARG